MTEKSPLLKQILDLNAQGVNSIEISEKLGVGYGVVKTRIKEAGRVAPLKRRRRRFSDDQFLDLYNQGLFNSEIAETLEVTESSVWKRRHNTLKLPPQTSLKKQV